MLTLSGKSLASRGIISSEVNEMKEVTVFVPDEVTSLFLQAPADRGIIFCFLLRFLAYRKIKCLWYNNV